MKKNRNASEEYVEIVRSVMKINKNVLEKYIETIRKAAEAISEITGWEWNEKRGYERFVSGLETINLHEYYGVSFEPKGIRWFHWIRWSSWDLVPLEEGYKSKEKGWKKIRMSTWFVFDVPDDEDEIPEGYDMNLSEYLLKARPRIKEAQNIVRKWANEASEKFKVRIKVKVNPEWGWAWLAFEFTPRSFNPDRIKRAFMALKYAYEGSLNELKEKKMVIFDKCLKKWVIVPQA